MSKRTKQNLRYVGVAAIILSGLTMAVTLKRNAPVAKGPAKPAVAHTHARPALMQTAQTLVCPLWRTDGAFVSKIHIHNSLMMSALAVTPTLYMADGTAYTLAPVNIPMSGEVTINLNDALASAPSWLGGHVSQFGSASLMYMWDGPGHVAANMNMKDLPHSLTFSQGFVIAPVANPMGTTAQAAESGYRQFQRQQARMVLASFVKKARQQAGTAAAAAMPPQALEGLWWKRDAGVTGGFSVANLSADPIAARYQITGPDDQPLDEGPVALGPHELRAIPLDGIERRSGGIRIEQLTMTPGGGTQIAAAGWLENAGEGFSATIEFAHAAMPAIPTDPGSSSNASSAPGPQTLAAAGLMFGVPMAANGFPAGTVFTPYGWLRNATARPLLVSLQVNLNGTPLPAPIPITLAPGGMFQVPLDQLGNRIQRMMGSGSAAMQGMQLNWSAAFTGSPGDLLMTTGSTDQSGNYVFEVMPQFVMPAIGRQIPFWSTGHGNDTMISLWNPGAAAQSVVLTLYTADGMHSYADPITLAPQASAMVDVAMLRAAGVPDASGNLLPPGDETGSAMIEPAGEPQPDKSGLIHMAAIGPVQMEITESVGVFNVQTATCCTSCAQCCFYSCPTVTGDTEPIGSTLQADMQCEDCCGWWWDCTSYASWSSDDFNIANPAGGGSFTAEGVGITDVYGSAFLEAPNMDDPYCQQGCTNGELQNSAEAVVTPVINSVTPDAILAGQSGSVTISGNGFGSSPSLDFPSGFSVSGQSSSNTSITFTLSVASTATLGNNSFSVINNDSSPIGTSANFIADYPSEMIVDDDQTLDYGGTGPTVEREVTYTVYTYSGNIAPLIQIGENYSTSSWTCTVPSGIGTTACPNGSTNGSGEFTDVWTLGTNSPSPAGCGFNFTTHWQWCALSPAKTFATLTGYIHQTAIEINGVVSPYQMSQGTVIKP